MMTRFHLMDFVPKLKLNLDLQNPEQNRTKQNRTKTRLSFGLMKFCSKYQILSLTVGFDSFDLIMIDDHFQSFFSILMSFFLTHAFLKLERSPAGRA